MKKSRQLQQAINSANRLCKDKVASDKKQKHNRKKLLHCVCLIPTAYYISVL